VTRLDRNRIVDVVFNLAMIAFAFAVVAWRLEIYTWIFGR